MIACTVVRDLGGGVAEVVLRNEPGQFWRARRKERGGVALVLLTRLDPPAGAAVQSSS